MTVYYVLFALTIVLAFVFKPDYLLAYSSPNGIDYFSRKKSILSKRNCLIYVFLMSLLIGVVIGFRSPEVGEDTKAYIDLYYFDTINNGIIRNDLEIVIRVLAWISWVIFPNQQLFLVVNGFLVSFLFGKFIVDNSRNKWLSFVVFLGLFFVQSMNLMREWLAIGFALNAYSYFVKKRFKTSFLLFLFAILSHLSSVILLLIPILSLIKERHYKVISVVAGCLLFLLLRNFIFGIIGYIFPKYSAYLTDSYFINESSSVNFKDLFFIGLLFLYTVIFYEKRSLLSKADLDRGVDYILFLTIALTLSLAGNTFYMLHRMVYYYSVFLIVSVPFFVRMSKYRNVLYVLLVIAFFYILYRNSISDNNGVSNYSWSLPGLL